MNIDKIIEKGQLGECLSTQEIESLMLYAIELLKLIETETQASITRAYTMLESHYEIESIETGITKPIPPPGLVIKEHVDPVSIERY